MVDACQTYRLQIGTILEDGNDFIPVLLYEWRSLTQANRRRIVAAASRAASS